MAFQNTQINLQELFTQHGNEFRVNFMEGVNRAINGIIEREITDLTEYAIRDALRPIIRDALREYVRRLLQSQNMGVEVFTNILGEMLPPPYEPPTHSGGDDAEQSGGDIVPNYENIEESYSNNADQDNNDTRDTSETNNVD